MRIRSELNIRSYLNVVLDNRLVSLNIVEVYAVSYSCVLYYAVVADIAVFTDSGVSSKYNSAVYLCSMTDSNIVSDRNTVCAAELDTLVKPLSYYLISCDIIECKQTTSVICTKRNMRICRNKCVSLFALCNKQLDAVCKIILTLSVLRLDVEKNFQQISRLEPVFSSGCEIPA